MRDDQERNRGKGSVGSLSKQTNIEDLGKELVKSLPLSRFNKIFRWVEHFDGETPETLLSRVRKETSKINISENNRSQIEEIYKKITHHPEFQSTQASSPNDCIKFLKARAKKDERYSLLFKLFEKADGTARLISLPFLTPYSDLETLFLRSCKSLILLERVNNAAGERRKGLLIDLILEVSETLYKPYLETIWRLSYLANSDMFPKVTPPFGELINQSANRLELFPGLVSRDLALLRNSFVHKKFVYDLESDSFIVWDSKLPRRVMLTDEVVKIANNVTNVCAETFPASAQLYVFRNFYRDTGFFLFCSERSSALSSPDQNEVLAASNEIKDFGERLMRPTLDFFQMLA